MASWIKRTRVGNRTYTTNMSTGAVRTTITTKRNKNSSGPTVSKSFSTNGKPYTTQTFKSGNMVKRERRTDFKQAKPKKIKFAMVKTKPLKIRRSGSTGGGIGSILIATVVLAIVVAAMVAL